MTKPTTTGLTITRADLIRALAATSKVVESRNTYPILANVHMQAQDNRLTVRATDLDIEISTSVPCQGALDPITAPARTLSEIAKKLPDGADISIEPTGETLIVKAGRSRFVVATLGADAFPDIAPAELPHRFTTDLGALLGRVSFAISNEATRYYLNGVYLHNPNGKLTAVATDGHRLGKITGAAAQDLPGVIIPTKMVGLVPLGDVEVELSDTKIRFSYGDTVVVSKLIEGTFPDYERVTPKNNDKTATFDRRQLLDTTERVSIVASDRGGKGVKIEVAADSATLSVRGENDAAQEDLPCEYGGDPFEVGYNARYLGDILRAYSSDKVTFAWRDSCSPALVTGEGDALVSVIMPMRV